MKYDIFLVDVDDTILDFHTAAIDAIKAAFESFGVKWQENFEYEFTKFNTSLWAQLERKEITREYLHETRFPRYLQILGFTDISGEEFNQKFLNHLSTHPIYFDGAKEFLTLLNKAGRVYFVTNGTLWIQKSRFDIADLWKYARDTFVSELAGADKPSKKYTDYVLERISNFDINRAIWIGDSLTADIQAAVDLGMDSIWYNPKKKTGKANLIPTFVVKNYTEILKILEISSET
jgi:YjjG family noncanonical pyrimidine nucleotidase